MAAATKQNYLDVVNRLHRRVEVLGVGKYYGDICGMTSQRLKSDKFFPSKIIFSEDF
jgi:hypothetical protein